MAHKTLINRTQSALDVVLTVRKGDLPKVDAGTVAVRLGPAPPSGEELGGELGEKPETEDTSRRDVAYGSDSDIYLNAIEVTALGDDAIAQKRDVVVERGSKLDRALNTHDTIEFLWDGHTIRISVTNSEAKPYAFPIVDASEETEATATDDGPS